MLKLITTNLAAFSPTNDEQSKTLLRSMLDLNVKSWEPLPGETQEEFEEAYFAGKHIFELAKAGSNQKSDLEFPPMKQMPTKENLPFQSQQSSGKPSEEEPRLQRVSHKARSSIASPTFHAQGIVPSIPRNPSRSAHLSSSPALRRQPEQVSNLRSDYQRGVTEPSESRQTALSESSGARNWQIPQLAGHHTHTRPGDHSSLYRPARDGPRGLRNQNPFGYGNSPSYQPPHSRRG